MMSRHFFIVLPKPSFPGDGGCLELGDYYNRPFKKADYLRL